MCADVPPRVGFARRRGSGGQAGALRRGGRPDASPPGRRVRGRPGLQSQNRSLQYEDFSRASPRPAALGGLAWSAAGFKHTPVPASLSPCLSDAPPATPTRPACRSGGLLTSMRAARCFFVRACLPFSIMVGSSIPVFLDHCRMAARRWPARRNLLKQSRDRLAVPVLQPPRRQADVVGRSTRCIVRYARSQWLRTPTAAGGKLDGTCTGGWPVHQSLRDPRHGILRRHHTPRFAQQAGSAFAIDHSPLERKK